MRHALYVPNFRTYASPTRLIELARETEKAGWDGIFLWDHMWLSMGLEAGQPVCDPWVALAAMATVTERILLGPMVTPVARRRPWKLAREIVTLDHLSGGRVVFGAGLGAPLEEYSAFGEDSDARIRARKLDEGLAVLERFLSGEEFSFEGEELRIANVRFGPRPVRDRIPVWIGGNWPAKPPFRRAARWDGVMPVVSGGFPTPDDVRAAREYVAEHRQSGEPFDVVACGFTRSADDIGPVAAMNDAGATWWLESLHDDLLTYDAALERVRQGPAVVDGYGRPNQDAS